MAQQRTNLMRDLAIVVLSIALAVIIVKTETLTDILTTTQEIKFLGAFIAGLFFTSIFTTAPATVVLAEIAQTNSIFAIALIGGLGALIGDLIIFRFVKDRLSEDFNYLIKQSKSKRLGHLFRLRFFRWLFAFLGALVIASPLPDELGLFFMGLSKIKTKWFIPLSFLLNSAGILVIGFIAKAILK